MKPKAVFTLCILLITSTVSASTFVVPDDAELVAKSAAIVIGSVEGSYAQEADGIIETVYEIRVERGLKNFASRVQQNELLRVVSPGGVLGDRGVHVEGAAHFEQGERVLLFLTPGEGRWTVTDLTLGKFRFVTSTAGEKLLVRDMENVVGWDRRGQVHREKVRKESGFLEFIREKMRGNPAPDDYLVEVSAVTLPPDEATADRLAIGTEAAFPGATYTSWVSGQPVRRATMSPGVTYYKRSTQNISGLGDGGVSVIQNGLAAWTNECGSVINLIYGGTTATASANFDGVNVVEFNDPQGRISGSWGGSGTIGLAFLSFQSSHPFEGRSWLSITDSDVVFQDGFPGTHGAFPTAMTHELGHTLGWRHSNQNHQTGGACNASVEECTSAAIMNSVVSSSYQYTLQPWDVNAAQSVYPGSTCGPVCTPIVITGQPSSSTISSGEEATLTVTATGTTPFTYQWYVGTSGNTSNPVPGATGGTLRVSPTSTTSYWVRVSNACGSANSNTATVTVNVVPTTPEFPNRTDQDGDGLADLFWRNLSTGQNVVWFMSGNNIRSAYTLPTLSAAWDPVTFGDFNGDGRDDVFWRNNSTGANLLWLMNGSTVSQFAMPSMTLNWDVGGSGDFNGDGRFDIFWRDPATGQNSLWIMDGATRSVVPVSTMSTAYHLAAVGDFNADHRFDWFWRNASSGNNVLWLQTTSGTQVTSSSSPTVSFVAGTGDINGDGRWDILWRNSSGGNGAMLMSGNGSSYTYVNLPTLAPSWTIGSIGSFDGDDDHDIVWRNSDGANLMWILQNGAVVSQGGVPGLSSSWAMYGYK